MQPRLTRKAQEQIEGRVDGLFDRLFYRLLGGSFTGKHIYFTTDPDFSLPALFRAGTEEQGGVVDTGLLDTIVTEAKAYVMKQKEETKAVVLRRIGALLRDVQQGKIEPENFRNHLESEMVDTWDRINSNVERVVNTESQHVMTMGVKDGLDQANQVRGVSDPVLVWVPKMDPARCSECTWIHLMPDETTPRAWLESEVSSDYHVRGEFAPSFHGLHPNCRCTMGSILPGFGLSASGRVTWIKEGFLEYEYQKANENSLGGVDERRAWES